MTKRPLCLGAAGVLSGILAAAYGWSVFARVLLACGVLACGILGGIFADGYRPGDGISPSERKRTAFGAGVFFADVCSWKRKIFGGGGEQAGVSGRTAGWHVCDRTGTACGKTGTEKPICL